MAVYEINGTFARFAGPDGASAEIMVGSKFGCVDLAVSTDGDAVGRCVGIADAEGQFHPDLLPSDGDWVIIAGVWCRVGASSYDDDVACAYIYREDPVCPECGGGPLAEDGDDCPACAAAAAADCPLCATPGCRASDGGPCAECRRAVAEMEAERADRGPMDDVPF